MKSAFGDSYFAQKREGSDWLRQARSFHDRLQPLLAALNLDVARQINQVVATKRSKVHSFLRSTSQLGKGDKGGIRTVVEVSDYLPPPVLAILQDLPEALIWVLLHRYQLADTERGLASIIDDYNVIAGSGRFALHSETVLEGLIGAQSFVRALTHTAVERVENIVQDIIRLPGDILGAYFFNEGRIELYWVPIWLVAGHLKVAPEDLATVVLVHEMGHLYSHKGHDAANGVWETRDFSRCDMHIVEGVAQFYTETFCMQLAKDGDDRCLEAFRRLKDKQPSCYSAHDNWAVGHEMRAEIIRQAIVAARSLSILDLVEFEKRIQMYRDSV